MSKARTAIKHGKAPKPEKEKAEFKTIQPGESVPAELAKDLPVGSLHADGKRKKSAIDVDDNESYAGEDAAQESILMRPDNPNRPANVEGEDQFKVAQGGAFGRGKQTDATGKEQVQEPSGGSGGTSTDTQ
jgi:hypothetical protein